LEFPTFLAKGPNYADTLPRPSLPNPGWEGGHVRMTSEISEAFQILRDVFYKQGSSDIIE